MSEGHDAAPGHDHHPQPPYLTVFAALVVFTVVSFWTVSALWPLSVGAGHMLVMLVAFIKATLVAMFFMHLRYDWFPHRLYFMIVPALIIGAALMCALLPDMTFADTRIVYTEPGE